MLVIDVLGRVTGRDVDGHGVALDLPLHDHVPSGCGLDLDVRNPAQHACTVVTTEEGATALSAREAPIGPMADGGSVDRPMPTVPKGGRLATEEGRHDG